MDVPANVGLENCTIDNPDLGGVKNCAAVGPKAALAFYPDDPSNVHHIYTGDFVKFRNVHAGPKEHHIFHLHNHQWLFNANDDNSNYMDAQALGPGSGYTYVDALRFASGETTLLNESNPGNWTTGQANTSLQTPASSDPPPSGTKYVRVAAAASPTTVTPTCRTTNGCSQINPKVFSMTRYNGRGQGPGRVHRCSC